MIYEVRTYENEKGHRIQARVGGEVPDFAFNGTYPYGVQMPDGKVIQQVAPLAFAIPAASVEDAFAALPELYKAHGEALVKQVQANLQAEREKQLRDILTN